MMVKIMVSKIAPPKYNDIILNFFSIALISPRLAADPISIINIASTMNNPGDIPLRSNPNVIIPSEMNLI